MRLLALSADDADAIFAALAAVRPVLRMLGPDARADLDGVTLTIRATLPGTPTFAAPAVETSPGDAAASLPGEAGPPRTGLPASHVNENAEPLTDTAAPVNAIAKPVRYGKAGNPHHKAWTEAEDERVVALWNEGRSAKQIAKAIGRSYGSIVQRIVVLKEGGAELIVHSPGGVGDGASRAWTDDEDERLLSMRAAGALWTEIGGALDRSDGACRLRHKKIEETVPAKLKVGGWSIEDDLSLAYGFADGQALADIAFTLERTPGEVRARWAEVNPERLKPGEIGPLLDALEAQRGTSRIAAE